MRKRVEKSRKKRRELEEKIPVVSLSLTILLGCFSKDCVLLEEEEAEGGEMDVVFVCVFVFVFVFVGEVEEVEVEVDVDVEVDLEFWGAEGGFDVVDCEERGGGIVV